MCLKLDIFLRAAYMSLVCRDKILVDLKIKKQNLAENMFMSVVCNECQIHALLDKFSIKNNIVLANNIILWTNKI